MVAAFSCQELVSTTAASALFRALPCHSSLLSLCSIIRVPRAIGAADFRNHFFSFSSDRPPLRRFRPPSFSHSFVDQPPPLGMARPRHRHGQRRLHERVAARRCARLGGGAAPAPGGRGCGRWRVQRAAAGAGFARLQTLQGDLRCCPCWAFFSSFRRFPASEGTFGWLCWWFVLAYVARAHVSEVSRSQVLRTLPHQLLVCLFVW